MSLMKSELCAKLSSIRHVSQRYFIDCHRRRLQSTAVSMLRKEAEESTTLNQSSSPDVSSSTKPATSKNSISWNDYFKLRQQRNRVRPVTGIPGALGGFMTVVTQYEFNPFEPMLGVDPPFIVMMGAMVSGLGGYQVGASLGQLAWRWLQRDKVQQVDQMDKMFYRKIKQYRAERGQSPYVNTMSNAASLQAMLKQKKSASGSAAPATTDNRQDYYGEKIHSVQDYRHWLRRQVKWNREHLGADYQPIRGVKI